MSKGILGKDYVMLKGSGGRDMSNGATSNDDKYIHLSTDAGQNTICGKLPKEFILTYADVDINCPACVKILTKQG